MAKTISIFTDGGARGNPGPAAIGFVIKNESGKVLVEKGKCIGSTTNNTAEYCAVIEALEWLNENLKDQIGSADEIKFYSDSALVVNQLNGLYKIKKNHLRQLAIKVKNLEKKLAVKPSYQNLAREKNYDADFLVNQALDEKTHNFSY